MKNKKNVVEEVKEVNEIEETIEETVDKQADLPAEVKKENFIVRGAKAVVDGVKKHGKTVVGITIATTLGAIAGATYAKNKYNSDYAGDGDCYSGDDVSDVIDLEPSEYTETSYEESVEE